MTLKSSIKKDEISLQKKAGHKKKKYQHGNTDAYNYYRIWARSPSFNDVNAHLTTIKVGVFGGIMGIITLLTYMVFLNVIISLSVALIGIVFFIIVFHDEMFSLRNIMAMRIRHASKINPFENLRFWTLKSDNETLFYTNIKDLISMGLRIFQVTKVAENVDPNYEHFFNSLSEIDVPFTYQVIQKPQLSVPSKRDSENIRVGKSSSSMKTIIYFCFFYDMKGTISSKKLRYLIEVLDKFSAAARNAFDANFNHFEILPLQGERLLNGFKNMFFQAEIHQTSKKMTSSPQRFTRHGTKTLYVALLLFFSDYLLEGIGIMFIFILVWNLGIIIAFIYLFWRDILFGFSRAFLNNIMGITPLDPFKNVKFYYYRHFPDCLFTVVNNSLIIGTKIFNLAHSFPPLFDGNNRPIPRIKKFIRAIIPQKIPLSFTHVMSPMRFSTFEEKAWNLLDFKTKRQVEWAKNASQQHDFMSVRKGIWRTIYTMAIHDYLRVTSFKIKYLSRLEESLYDKMNITKAAFKMNMIKSHGEMLTGNKLISGFLLECLKSKHFRLNGTHLHYLLYQGEFLSYLVEIFPEFKKGIETKIASEFNTPFDLKNYITIGHTINTEVYREETEAGFTLNQLRELLITGGTNSSRELTMMRMVIELIETKTPSLVFDFSGNWSKIVNYFRNTRYEDKILYFILGKSFLIDPIKSDIQYDMNNMNYLKYIVDVLSLVFQKDDKVMEAFKQSILKFDPDLMLEKDSSTLAQEMEYTPQWEKDKFNDSINSIFSDFIEQDMKSMIFSQDPDETITVRDFIEEDNTVIIDVSHLKTLQKKMFAAFIIMSKIIHYIESGKTFTEKMLFIPNLEIMFPNRFMERTGKHGKIDQFLEPLMNARMGIIASLESVTSLHPHAYSFFPNYIALRTVNRQDISQLGTLMNFRKIYGAGIYSSSRNETFQVNYLMNMKKDEIIVKRSDIDQPFPVKLDLKELMNTPQMEYEELVAFMKQYGYNFEHSEKRIIQQARKTIFKKDFDNYYAFIDEIINFLEAVKKMDKIGNLYKNKLKEDLMTFIYPRAIKIAGSQKKKREIRNWRNDIFNILLIHRYLVENHPKQAGGGESIRTSYSVGPQYERALKDYYESKRDKNDELFTEIVSKESLEGTMNDLTIDEVEEENGDRLIGLLRIEFKSLFDAIFNIHRQVKAKQFIDAQRLEREVLSQFFDRLYSAYKGNDVQLYPSERDSFLDSLTSLEGFPVSGDYLMELLQECKNIEVAEGDMEVNVSSLYDKLNDFMNTLSVFVSSNS